MPYVYILRCADDSYYVGSTMNLELRIWQHNHTDEDGAVYTRRRRPVELAWAEEVDSMAEAFSFEKRVQGWSRAKREALIRGDFDALPGLAGRSHAARQLREGLRAAEVSRRALGRPPQPPP